MNNKITVGIQKKSPAQMLPIFGEILVVTFRVISSKDTFVLPAVVIKKDHITEDYFNLDILFENKWAQWLDTDDEA